MLPKNKLTWDVLKFYGVDNALNDFSMDEFEKFALSKCGGVSLVWFDLTSFARSLYQTYDCLIVAAKSQQDILGDKLGLSKRTGVIEDCY